MVFSFHDTDIFIFLMDTNIPIMAEHDNNVDSLTFELIRAFPSMVMGILHINR